MADVLTPEQRRYNMSRIHGKDTKPEELVRKYLFSRGFRYRKNDPRFPGKPDIVFPKYKTVIFEYILNNDKVFQKSLESFKIFLKAFYNLNYKNFKKY